MRHLRALLLIFFVIVAGTASSREPLPTDEFLASIDGEHLYYDITWSGIFAGRASLNSTAKDETTHRFTVLAKSSSGIAFLYPMDIRYDSIVEKSDFRSLVYIHKGKEGWGNKHVRRVDFDHEKGESRYVKDGKLKKVLEVTPDHFDPISILYGIRNIDLPEPGNSVPLKIADGSKVVTGTLEVIGYEKVKTKLGTFDTIRVVPVLEGVRGIFGSSPNSRMNLWFTRDDRMIIVKILSKVSIGHFTALLEKAKFATPVPPQDPQPEREAKAVEEQPAPESHPSEDG